MGFIWVVGTNTLALGLAVMLPCSASAGITCLTGSAGELVLSSPTQTPTPKQGFFGG